MAFVSKVASLALEQADWVGCRCYVQLDFVWQFKTDLVQRLEGLIFEKKKFLT